MAATENLKMHSPAPVYIGQYIFLKKYFTSWFQLLKSFACVCVCVLGPEGVKTKIKEQLVLQKDVVSDHISGFL